jgi:hypothetical protein
MFEVGATKAICRGQHDLRNNVCVNDGSADYWPVAGVDMANNTAKHISVHLVVVIVEGKDLVRMFNHLKQCRSSTGQDVPV